MLKAFFCSAVLLTAAPALLSAAESADAAWARITALDAGPQTQFHTQAEARTGSLSHLAQQEKALRDFLTAYRTDAHAFEAWMRLARLLQIRAGLEGNEALRVEARKILDRLYETTSGDQHAEVDFARLAFTMRTMRVASPAQREQLLSATTHFRTDYPSDRRLPALLAEVAGVFDDDPSEKRNLLLQAQALAKDPALTQRIADDLKRLELLGRPLALHLPTISGRPLDLAAWRGQVVVLVFFADFSPPSTDAVSQLQRAARDWPAGAVQVVGISLDSQRDDLVALLRRQNIGWPIAWDGLGWKSPAARELGINRLPTVWLLDQTGVVRSQTGLVNTTDRIRALLRSAPGR